MTVFLEDFLKKLIFRKSADDNKSMKNYPACKELNTKLILVSGKTGTGLLSYKEQFLHWNGYLPVATYRDGLDFTRIADSAQPASEKKEGHLY